MELTSLSEENKDGDFFIYSLTLGMLLKYIFFDIRQECLVLIALVFVDVYTINFFPGTNV